MISKNFWLLVIASAFVVPVFLASAQEDSPRGAAITIPGDRFFPEGVTVDAEGTFYVGSMEEGSIMRVPANMRTAEPFIEAGANGLVSVLGLYADDARGLLWACSSDAGNAVLSGSAPVALKSFDLKTGEPVGSYEFPGGGFCNDITIDSTGNVYVTDSWAPRILRLPNEGSELEVWVEDDLLGPEQWSLNGIDIGSDALYTVNIATGQLFRISVEADGSAGEIVIIETSKPLRRPDGLKLIADNLLAVAETESSGMALIELTGDTGTVKVISEGLDGVATFAYWEGSAWLLENQGQHFWDPNGSGADATPPFRIVEIPLPI